MKATVKISKVGFTKSGRIQLTIVSKDIPALAEFDNKFKAEHAKDSTVMYNVSGNTAQIALSENLVAGICRSNGMKALRPDLLRGAVAKLSFEPRIAGSVVNGATINKTHLGVDIDCTIDENRLDDMLDKQYEVQMKLATNAKVVNILDDIDDVTPIPATPTPANEVDLTNK